MTREHFLELLKSLGFKENGNVLSKSIGNTSLAVDPVLETLIYPENDGLKITARHTCDFSSPENFVVFECVHRLLEKGYAARHIELEPKWKLGHGSSGGRADILISDNAEKPLLIIECKTAGKEFEKYWNRTLRDGDQLFSYAQQIPETEFLCLYASDFVGGELSYRSHIIAHRDNEKYLAANTGIRSFKEAGDVTDRYRIWRDTYKLDHTLTGIFEDTIQPYQIGKDKYSIADLKQLSAADQTKQYHRFATILRQHNVSGRENAFDKLVNLLLCKLVDETENPDDLKFYWKGVAYDTHFELLDRLQQLYQRGMGKFLGEEITYINQDDVTNALRFIKQNPDATQRAVWNLFIQQKFFTNNDFSLIDVHNEKLFYQNAEILLKILQMWQGVRLVNEIGHNQFLGDMFEFFLDQGVKQSEGQYFTPMPICRFLLMSLPLEVMVKKTANPPKAIDYACGAGHFINELALQLKPLVQIHHPLKDLSDYHECIHGIEKEYRLSKIAKVSSLMYQQPGIRICYADALVHDHAAYPEIQNGTFDILVAKPPFSVKGFLETLPDESRSHYRLTDTVNDTDTANSIETFFVERAAQLLRPGGIAAIILPASILSNGGSSYTAAREILLAAFEIIAIAEFGSGTFGKTGTNTVTLFLRRKPDAPASAEHYKERIADWFQGIHSDKKKAKIYKDSHLLAAYAAHIGTTEEDYKTFLAGAPSDTLLAHDTFTAYRREFDASTEIKNLLKQKKFTSLSKSNQSAELTKRWLAYLRTIEQDKLLHYLLAAEQDNQVLILKSPNDTKERKTFLGYEWSSAKGDEGIKLIKDANDRHLTPLYDEADRNNTEKINHIISQNFLGTLSEIPETLQPFLSLASLPDLIDFSRTSFEKQISLSARESLAVVSKWPVTKLSDSSQVNPSKQAIASLPKGTLVSFVEMSSVSCDGFIESSVERSIDELRKGSFTYFADEDIIIAKINPCMENGKCALARNLTNGVGMGSSEFHVIRTDRTKLLPAYAFDYINRKEVRKIAESNMTGSSGHRRVPSDFYSDLRIPLPPLDTQQKIVTECEAIDKETSQANDTVTKARETIETEVEAIYSSSDPRQSIDSIAESIQYGLSKPMNEGGVGYKIFRMNEIAHGRMVDGGSMKTIDITAEEFAAYQLSPGDVLFNRTNSIEHVGKTGLYDLAGEHTFASYLVRIVPDTKKIHPLFLTYMMNSREFQSEAKASAAKAINQANINATKMRNMLIPVPSLKDQQRFVKTVESHEAKVIAAEAILSTASTQKAAILKKYL
jgi:type I restriction enzyme M protein